LKGLNYEERTNKNIKEKKSCEWFKLQTKERRVTRTLRRIVVARDSNFIPRTEEKQEHHEKQ
jgi:hypothetical protein